MPFEVVSSPFQEMSAAQLPHERVPTPQGGRVDQVTYELLVILRARDVFRVPRRPA